MKQDQVWAPHLQPGEHIVWSASFSPDIRKADRRSSRFGATLWAVISGLLAALCVYRLYEAVTGGESQSSLAVAVTVPLYAAFGLALAIFSAFMLRRLKLPPPHADHYAITDRRLLAVDQSGVLVDEMQGADIGGVIFNTSSPPSEMHVIRRDENDGMFFVEHLSDLHAFKARIEQQFPDPPDPATHSVGEERSSPQPR